VASNPIAPAVALDRTILTPGKLAVIYLPASVARPGTVYARECAGSKGGTVLYYALVFLVIALIAGLLGVSGVASVATNIAYVLFVIAIVLFLVHLLSGRRTLVP